MHNGAKYTAQALPKVIEGLKAQGYEIVPISKLIYKDNYQMDATGRQKMMMQMKKIVEGK